MLNVKAVRNVHVISNTLGGKEKQYTTKKFVAIMLV